MSTSSEPFQWLVGIEDTAIGVPLPRTGRTLDEHALTDHDRRWREDLDLVADLGADGLRYGLPWYRVNLAPGVYDWRMADAALEHAAGVLGLRVIVDLVHYGVPAWLRGGFADPGYPDAVATWAGAVAHRYGDLIAAVTPLNEPAITAAFCGEVGGWPPYLSGPRGWTTVAVAVARGIQQSIQAVRDEAPSSSIVHVEAAKLVRATAPDLQASVDQSRQRAWLTTDLALGRVDATHPMTPWLLAHGADRTDLEGLAAARPRVDLMGVNFYPQYSVRELVRVGDDVVEVAGGGTGQDLVTVLDAFATRYGVPVAVTETSFDGSDDARATWARESASAVLEARDRGLDVRAYTWWPLFDFVDWGYATGDVAFEDFQVRTTDADGATVIAPMPSPGRGNDPAAGVGPWLRRMGLWRLEPDADGLRRVATSAATAMREVMGRARGVQRASGDATPSRQATTP
ncbi:MAG: family 1 glycosylhydrolase [Chloroflexota bacterium]